MLIEAGESECAWGHGIGSDSLIFPKVAHRHSSFWTTSAEKRGLKTESTPRKLPKTPSFNQHGLVEKNQTQLLAGQLK